MAPTLDLSVVVPVYNEEDNLPVLTDEIIAAMQRTGKSWEIIYVDDGSTDSSLDVIKRLGEEHPEIRYLAFACNCGQSAAFGAGFEDARGEIVITMDADLQNDPADIPEMLRVLEEGGHDMVIGWRANRQDTCAKRWASKFGNAVRNRLSGENVKDTGCSLKLMRQSLACKLPMFTGMHRFLPTLMKMRGATVAEVKVNHRARLHGSSKYGIWDRARMTLFDLLAIRWMQRRHVNYRIRERKEP